MLKFCCIVMVLLPSRSPLPAAPGAGPILVRSGLYSDVHDLLDCVGGELISHRRPPLNELVGHSRLQLVPLDSRTNHQLPLRSSTAASAFFQPCRFRLEHHPFVSSFERDESSRSCRRPPILGSPRRAHVIDSGAEERHANNLSARMAPSLCCPLCHATAESTNEEGMRHPRLLRQTWNIVC